MNSFDAVILHFLNGFAHHSWTADYLIVWLTTDGLQKGGLVMLLFWWVWFKPGEESKAHREVLICTTIASILAIVVARSLSYLLPFRLRPLHVPDLHLNLAYTVTDRMLAEWSSFPSDHAVVFFTFVAGFFLISGRLGLIVLLQALVVVCLPRVYLGYHAPTDIIAGAVLGAGMAYVACLPKIRGFLVRPVHEWCTKYPAWFYAFLFLYTQQVVNMFMEARKILSIAGMLWKALVANDMAQIVMLPALAGFLAGAVLLGWCVKSRRSATVGKQPVIGEPAKVLELSPEQQRTIHSILEAEPGRELLLSGKQANLRQHLQQLATAPVFDEAAVRSVATALANAEMERTVSRARMQSQINAILTDEQRAAAQNLVNPMEGSHPLPIRLPDSRQQDDLEILRFLIATETNDDVFTRER